MKIVSGIIMLIGLGLGVIFLMAAKSAPQEAISLVPIIGAYVLGRALENFTNQDDEVVVLLKKLSVNKSEVKSDIKTKDSAKVSSEEKKSINEYDLEEYFEMKSKAGKGDIIICRKHTNELSIITEEQYQSDKELHITGQYKVLWGN